MSKFGTLVMGPAGAGKTTFCNALIQHLRLNKRSCFYVNLDPAAEDFSYEPDLDIKDLISLEDVMEEMSLGPNGGLIYCFEWASPDIPSQDPITEEYLIILDLPGQIELYTHIPVIPTLVKHLTRFGGLNISLCAAYLLESTFVIDRAKFFAGTLSAMSAMIMLEIPHVNILSKMDLVKGSVPKRQLKRFLEPDATLLEDDDAAGVREERAVDPSESGSVMGGNSFKRLNKAVAQLIDDFSMVSFLQLDVQDEDSVGGILSYMDDAIQFSEAQEPRTHEEIDYGDNMME
ncbi:MAG: hypothetical protein Q9212_000359 [Teloschistes hypoglaucus]